MKSGSDPDFRIKPGPLYELKVVDDILTWPQALALSAKCQAASSASGRGPAATDELTHRNPVGPSRSLKCRFPVVAGWLLLYDAGQAKRKPPDSFSRAPSVTITVHAGSNCTEAENKCDSLSRGIY